MTQTLSQITPSALEQDPLQVCGERNYKRSVVIEEINISKHMHKSIHPDHVVTPAHAQRTVQMSNH